MVAPHPVDEDASWVSPVSVDLAELLEELCCINVTLNSFMHGLKVKMELLVVTHRLHEFVSELNADVHGGKLFVVLLNTKELVDVRMVGLRCDHPDIYEFLDTKELVDVRMVTT